MKYPIRANGSKHSCDMCIHISYCKKDIEELVAHGERKWTFENEDYIPIPDNCPLRDKEVNPSRRDH